MNAGIELRRSRAIEGLAHDRRWTEGEATCVIDAALTAWDTEREWSHRWHVTNALAALMPDLHECGRDEIYDLVALQIVRPPAGEDED